MPLFFFVFSKRVASLKLTNIAPENWPKPKGEVLSNNNPFFRGNSLVFRSAKESVIRRAKGFTVVGFVVNLRHFFW